MSQRQLSLILRWTAVVGGMLSLITTGLTAVTAGLAVWVTGFDAFVSLFVWFFGVFVWLVAARQPRNAVVWTMASGVLFGGLVQLASVFVHVQYDLDPAIVLVPAELPAGAARILLFTGWMWIPALLPILTLGVLLFPDGQLPSPRWRWVGWLAGAGMILLAIGTIWTYRPSNTNQVEEGPTVMVPFLIVLIAAILSVAGLISRSRRSTGDTRQQIKWILWGLAIFIPTFLGLGFVLGQGPYEYLLIGPIYAAEVVFLGSYGMAVAKYRLYDIDLIISRTLVYGALAAFIGAVYVGMVVGLGYVIGAQDGPNTWLGVVATVVIAIAFQPLRRRLQQLANRIVYGRRATPYEVLSSFARSISAVDPDVLVQVAKSLAEGTTADSASIWVDRGGVPRCMAAWPEPHDDIASSGVAAPVVHDGEELGRVVLEVPPGQPFPVTDQRLLDQVAAGLGLALRNMQLTEDLKARVEELAASRRRIVTLQDETRRKLERDLHDGAQQRLVALKIKLGIGSAMAEKAGLDDVRQVIDTVREETDHTIDSVRDFARGIYPPLLESEGLGQALSAQARKMPIPVTVQAAGLGRYPKDQEATVYFCVLEALQNAMKHSEASSVQVLLTERDGELGFEVRDDGLGFDQTMVAAGGLVNMMDRLEAVGGRFRVDSEPGRGTAVSGSVPLQMVVTS